MWVCAIMLFHLSGKTFPVRVNFMNKYVVYMHICPNGKKYIGITGNFKKRCGNNGDGYKNIVFYNAVKKYGWNNIEHLILHENLTEQDAKAKEIELIAFYKTTDRQFGYNISKGGSATFEHYGKMAASYGRILSQETKQKISIANSGKIHSNETKNKMSEYHKGKQHSLGFKHTDETKKKWSDGQSGSGNGFYGKSHSDKSKAIISQKAKDRNMILGDNPNSKEIKIFYNNEIIVFSTRKECAEYLGIEYYSLWRKIKSGKIIVIE